MDTYTLLRRSNPRAVGMEIFEIKPILLGGDPADLANKTLLTRQQHFEAVRYWNGVIRTLSRSRGQF